MEITVEQAIVAKKAIESIKELKLPAKVSYRLERLLNKLNPIIESFDKARNSLVTEKYGVASEEDPNKYSVIPDKMQDFLKEIGEILTSREDVGHFEPINIDSFGAAEIPLTFFTDMAAFITE